MKICKDCEFCNLADVAPAISAPFYDREADEVAKCLHDGAQIVLPALGARPSYSHPDYCSSVRANSTKCGADAIWFVQK